MAKKKSKSVGAKMKPKVGFKGDVIFKKSPQILSRSVDDRTIAVVHLERHDLYFTIDEMAADCFEHFDGKTNLAKILNKLEIKYKADSKFLEKETQKFLTQLMNEKLIQIV